MRALALAALLALAACATPPPAPTKPLYERIGGLPAIEKTVDDALVTVLADTRINARFRGAGPQLRQHLVDLMCERTGGPCTYTGKNMADAHEGMFITDAEFDAMVEDLMKTVDKFGTPPRERAELLALLLKTRNAITGH